MLELGLKTALGYLLGSVIGALVVGRIRGGVDIRQTGSGNAGGTNALRTQGKWFALWVMVIDVGKGILAAACIPGLELPGVGLDPAVDRAVVLYAVALAAIVGHVFPLWFGFRGGKGGATAAGLLCYLSLPLGGIILLVWLGIVFFTGYVGLATVAASAAAALWVMVSNFPAVTPFVFFAVAVAVLITYTHRTNISRMLNGTEARFGRYFGLR